MSEEGLHSKTQQSFFDLPAEIRNDIYDELKVTRYSRPLKAEYRPYVYIETLVPHARLINRRLKQEAEAQISKSSKLTLKDRSGEGCGSPAQLRRPGWSWCLELVTHVEVEMHLWCENCRRRCTVTRGLSHDIDWLERLVMDLPKLESVDVAIYFMWFPDCEESWTDVPYGTSGAPAFGTALKRLVREVPQTTNVKAYRRFSVSEDLNPTSISGQHLEFWVRWDTHDRWQTPEGQIKP